jgi:alkylation response protein AidB-like acyl-CoA dehydrogenase
MFEFRAEVRAFLGEALTPELRAWSARQAGVFAEPELARVWHRILYDKGWIAPAWPEAWGGTGWTPQERLIFETECALAGAPALPAMGLQMCGPVLIMRGTQAQKDYFLPRILSGEHYWCQGYSEPQSGSDLASIRCRAVRDGDDYVIDGDKIWTTHAHAANWIFVLVRTGAGGRPQEGITFLLVPLDSPGVTVRPILSMSGEHEVNQVFFDGVRTPATNRVGEENEGWAVAKELLEFERGGPFACARALRILPLVIAQAKAYRVGGRSLHDDPAFQRDLSLLEIELAATEWTQRRVVASLDAGEPVGVAASILKLKATECFERATELGLQTLGPYAAADQRRGLETGAPGDIAGPTGGLTFAARYMNGQAISIFGGASEIQRNILAKAALGL